MSRQRTDTCPNCGAEFRAGRLACPECGADAETAWKSQEELDYLSVELPDHDVEGEFDAVTGTYRKRASRGWLLAILLGLFAAFLIALLR